MKNLISVIAILALSINSFAQLSLEQHAYVDSLKLDIENATHDTTRADRYLGISTVYYLNSQGGTSFRDMATKARDISEENLAKEISTEERSKFSTILADAINAIGLYHYSIGEIEETEKLLLQAASIHFENKDYGNLLTILFNLSAMHSGVEDIPKSMQYLKVVIEIAQSKEGRNEMILATALAQMGHDTYSIDPELSQNYHQASYDLFVRTDDKHGQARQLLNLGDLQADQENYNSALEFYEQALALSIEDGDKVSEIWTYASMSDIYVKTDTALAISYYQKALTISKSIEHTDMILSNQNSLSELYFESDFDSSKYYAYLNVNLLNDYQARPGTQHKISRILTEVYERDGKFKDALIEHRKYISLKDSLFNIENKQEVIQQNLSYEYATKKAVDDKENEKKLAIERKDKEKQTVITWAAIGGLLLLLVFSVFIFNRFKVTSKQKVVIESQTHQIVESINYSQRIQNSLLPQLDDIAVSFKNLFIFYEPKDIVSGDFYWFKDFDNHQVMACVDCTGHGVPGGFMSTMGSLLLNKVVTESESDPAKLLVSLNREIIETLHQENKDGIQDGMDLSICVIDKLKNQVKFSGARNGIMLMRDNQITRYKADLLPVGGNYLKKGKPIERIFSTQIIDLKPNDWIYMYTDGFMEQCGISENLPMNYTQFQNVLLKLNNETQMTAKNKILKDDFDSWRGSIKQSDDVLIIGFQKS